MRALLTLSFATLASAAFAAGGDEDTPPTPTQTTTVCEDNQVYDEETKSCVAADEQSLHDTQRYNAVRELAYAGDYDRALSVLAAAKNPMDPRFLNYQGFISRKQGDIAKAIFFYQQALAIDPDYNLARSYMGQGLFAAGDIAGAEAQLSEIAARGGKQGWPYRALAMTLNGIKGGSY
ncbi:MAG: tetratricopeptide repeat protein [Silicimonas sp.]|nr:tetratricopeptide repeat protein [Silicimonas sp.]